MGARIKSYGKTAVNVLRLCAVAAFIAPGTAGAEFYSYEDSKGTMHFVEDRSKIPKEYRHKKQVRKDEYDDLSPEEQAQLREREREKRDANRQREAEQQEQSRQQRAAQEKKAAQELRAKALTTRVVISGRQVFVPVTLRNGSSETNVMLLLDTGATSSVITPQVAERLNVQEADNVKIGVVGGRVMSARKIVLSRMVVGPITRENQEAVIVRQRQGEFGDGLLGMSFLAGLKYTLDFDAQTINWLP